MPLDDIPDPRLTPRNTNKKMAKKKELPASDEPIPLATDVAQSDARVEGTFPEQVKPKRRNGPKPVWLGNPTPPSDYRLLRAEIVTWSSVQLLSGVRNAQHAITSGGISDDISTGFKNALAIYCEEINIRYSAALPEFIRRNELEDVGFDQRLADAKNLS
jgi:hypothetical protein